MFDTRDFSRWVMRNPIRPKESQSAYANRYMATLRRGDRVICRDRRGGQRVADAKIWAKLNNEQRGQWIERIRAEQLA